MPSDLYQSQKTANEQPPALDGSDAMPVRGQSKKGLGNEWKTDDLLDVLTGQLEKKLKFDGSLPQSTIRHVSPTNSVPERSSQPQQVRRETTRGRAIPEARRQRSRSRSPPSLRRQHGEERGSAGSYRSERRTAWDMEDRKEMELGRRQEAELASLKDRRQSRLSSGHRPMNGSDEKLPTFPGAQGRDDTDGRAEAISAATRPAGTTVSSPTEQLPGADSAVDPGLVSHTVQPASGSSKGAKSEINQLRSEMRAALENINQQVRLLESETKTKDEEHRIRLLRFEDHLDLMQRTVNGMRNSLDDFQFTSELLKREIGTVRTEAQQLIKALRADLLQELTRREEMESGLRDEADLRKIRDLQTNANLFPSTYSFEPAAVPSSARQPHTERARSGLSGDEQSANDVGNSFVGAGPIPSFASSLASLPRFEFGVDKRSTDRGRPFSYRSPYVEDADEDD